jgi:hypothetical protein
MRLPYIRALASSFAHAGSKMILSQFPQSWTMSLVALALVMSFMFRFLMGLFCYWVAPMLVRLPDHQAHTNLFGSRPYFLRSYQKILLINYY